MEVMQMQPELVQPPALAKRPRFPRRPYDSERFVDPKKEAALILPEQQLMAQGMISLEFASAPKYESAQRSESFFTSIYSYLASWLSWVKKRFKGSRRQRAKMTRMGEQALSQLKYLSQLCDATECRTTDEVLAFEGAFGEAYFEIMSLSANLARIRKGEEEHHVKKYTKHMGKLLRAVD